MNELYRAVKVESLTYSEINEWEGTMIELLVEKGFLEVSPDDHIDIIARRMMHQVVMAWQEEGWGNYLAEIGEGDYEAVCERMNQLLPTDPTLYMHEDAYRALEERARTWEAANA